MSLPTMYSEPKVIDVLPLTFTKTVWPQDCPGGSLAVWCRACGERIVRAAIWDLECNSGYRARLREAVNEHHKQSPQCHVFVLAGEHPNVRTVGLSLTEAAALYSTR